MNPVNPAPHEQARGQGAVKCARCGEVVSVGNLVEHMRIEDLKSVDNFVEVGHE